MVYDGRRDVLGIRKEGVSARSRWAIIYLFGRLAKGEMCIVIYITQ